jgi:hypothetical protein
MAELNPNAKKWVDALRSGKYKQGKRALTTVEDGEEFDCCLGVACKVAIENGLELETHVAVKRISSGSAADEYEVDKQLRFYDNFSYGTLPYKVTEWLGLDTADARYNGIGTNLTTDNDNGKTFEQIAAIVESKPQGLFRDGL